MTLGAAILVSASLAPAQARSGYGPGIAADSLNNTIVGGPRDTKVSYRFKARVNSKLRSLRVYVITDKPGYGAGTGGTLRITVRKEAPGSRRPSGTVLARTVVRNVSSDVGARFSFSDSPRLLRGKHYHIVFENVDNRPSANYFSLNGLYVFEQSGLWQPAYPAGKWSQLTKVSGGPWTASRSDGAIVPIMDLTYGTGVHQGVGYMEVWTQSTRTISGSNRVREHFTVGGADRKVSSVAVRLKRTSGSSSLRVGIVDSAGVWLAKGRIRSHQFPQSSVDRIDGGTWAHAKLNRDVRLKSGSRYRLVLWTDADTRYRATAVRKGTSYGYHHRTYYSDGHAEYTSGSGWRLFTGWFGRPSKEADLQFYLR